MRLKIDIQRTAQYYERLAGRTHQNWSMIVYIKVFSAIDMLLFFKAEFS